MKVTTNKTAKKKESSESKEMKVDTSTPSKSPETPANFSIEAIKNGFLVRKSWTDKNGHYQNETEFRQDNPLDLEVTDKK